jgi:hypothetical protein
MRQTISKGFQVRTRDRRFVAMVGKLSLFGVREISWLQRKSGYQKHSCAAVTKRRRSMMTKFTLLGVVANLSAAIATTSLAPTAIQEMGAFASYHQDGNLGIAPTPIQRREVTVVGRGTADVMASAPSIPSSRRGLETTTRPWSAPVGHRQPRAADVQTSTSASRQSLDEEDANVDRKIKGVCRGC